MNLHNLYIKYYVIIKYLQFKVSFRPLHTTFSVCMASLAHATLSTNRIQLFRYSTNVNKQLEWHQWHRKHLVKQIFSITYDKGVVKTKIKGGLYMVVFRKLKL